MSEVATELILGVIRFGGYVGYVLLAGTLAFWSLIWPAGGRDRRLVGLATGGAVLLLVTTVTGPLVLANAYGVSVPDAVGQLGGLAALARIGALAVVLGLLPDLAHRRSMGPAARVSGAAASGVIAVTLVLQSDAVGSDWPIVTVTATAAHVLAAATWLGGLVALATVVIPTAHRDVVHLLLPRFSTLAILSVTTLAVSGVVHAVVIAGGVGPLLASSYGAVLIVKATIFGVMLVLGNRGRAYAASTRRTAGYIGPTATAGLHGVAFALGIEIALAVGVLAVTSVLVAVAPVATG